MLYFTKFFVDDSPLIDAENSTRKYSLKRHMALDFVSSSSNIGQDKYFFANEKPNYIRITRIRTSFEWLLPKLIINVPKDLPYNFKVRYCFLSSLILEYLCISIISNLYFAVSEGYLELDIFYLIGFLIVFILLTFVELKMTKRKITQILWVENP